MICLLYASDQTSCIAYISPETVGAFIVMFSIFWGLYSLFKIVLALMGFNI